MSERGFCIRSQSPVGVGLAAGLDLRTRLVVDVRLVAPDKLHSQLVQLLEIAAGVGDLPRLPAHPAHNVHDVVDVLLLLRLRVGVVVP